MIRMGGNQFLRFILKVIAKVAEYPVVLKPDKFPCIFQVLITVKCTRNTAGCSKAFL
jgi:hypothetical protein